jgi:serine/threonine-protein kinase HSL1 (negative regulator of Swe1 kinase)
MILEFVENGELFEHIHRSGYLDEEEAITYFRQVLSAVGYCHSFNICHRDLKPENILLNHEGNVRIADFGMAALHQTPDHKLRTSCGSPHYAAPEVIRGIYYRGDKVDIWSMGVILYASLAGFLPFDASDVKGLLETIKTGKFRMADHFSDGVADLIRGMLQVNPKERLSINQIWAHPLIRKYDYLDDYGGGLNSRSPDIRQCIRPVLRKSEIDRELLRHLQSLWHTFDERKLIKSLLNEE